MFNSVLVVSFHINSLPILAYSVLDMPTLKQNMKVGLGMGANGSELSGAVWEWEWFLV